ncbi:MAG: 2-C-methyl-D-erythritol 4-phosphate cytidylyltransferase [Bacteroidaceae bacterium]|nr:2-C-methyl-D-erythritol 4-phosphate cytidylyltransferase [Bacteroidaceae bacterium]
MAVLNSVIIVAGGKGLRMGGDIPKQFLVVNGKPILMHTIQRFYDFDPEMQIIVVLPKDQQTYWDNLCQQYHFNLPFTVADGGAERFHSVKNGLAKVKAEAALVGVHDGVRPYVAIDVIRRCYEAAATKGAAIPVTDVFETLRHLTPDGGSQTVPRGEYRLVQTPQVFQTDLLRKAYEQEFTSSFTDDASVVEALGYTITLVEGNRENIKITTKADL